MLEQQACFLMHMYCAGRSRGQHDGRGAQTLFAYVLDVFHTLSAKDTGHRATVAKAEENSEVRGKGMSMQIAQ